MMEIDVNQDLTIRFEAGSMKGEPGNPGITPHIGDNGNWFSGETDTGVPATGKDAPVPVISVEAVEGGHKVTVAVGDTVEAFTVMNGENGDDAPVPEVNVEAITGGHRVTVTVGDVVQSFDVLDGKQGDKGDPGLTPVIDVTDTADGHRVTITVGENVQSFDVPNGKDGNPGQPGTPGTPGKDGLTPAVSVTEIENGHRVTITTGSDVQSFDVLNGKDVESGGVVDSIAWENVIGKPFNESLTGTAVPNGDTLSWDGNKAAMPIITGNVAMKFAYVSDNVPTMEELGAGFTLTLKTYAGTEMNINIAPAEYENYILIGDMDGHYLYIVKQPFTSGNNAFERAGIYFYAHGSADHYICRLQINGYTFTEMGSIKEAYIPKSIARKSDIPQGGGAQVQSDYTQHDATKPDYIHNRPFWPEWSPVMLDDVGRNAAINNGGCVYLLGIYYAATGRKHRPPIESKRYTFGVRGGNVYTGVAARGHFETSVGSTVYGIGIVDEQNSNALAVYPEDSTNPGILYSWQIDIPDRNPDGSTLNDGKSVFFVIEGDNTYDKLSTDDIMENMSSSFEGVSVVYDLAELFRKADAGDTQAQRMSEAIANDVEFTIEMDGVEITVPSTDIVYVEETEMMGFRCSLYMYGQAPLAAILRMSNVNYLGLLDLKKLMGAGPTTKSIKVNYPGIFASNVPAKKMPMECMPDNVTGSYVITAPVEAFSDASSTKIMLTDNYDDFAGILYSGGNVWIDMSAVISAMYGYNAVLRLAVIAWIFVGGALTLTVRNTSTGEGVLEFVFTNGTWTPPTA